MIDAWHVHWGSGSYADLAALPGARITGVQLCDAPAKEPENYGYATRHQRVAPGRGAADLPLLLTMLRDIGSAAPICLEVFDTPEVERIGPVAWACEMANTTRSLFASSLTPGS
jgi:4-hydroxyphenylpyruvate dioxygenase